MPSGIALLSPKLFATVLAGPFTGTLAENSQCFSIFSRADSNKSASSVAVWIAALNLSYHSARDGIVSRKFLGTLTADQTSTQVYDGEMDEGRKRVISQRKRIQYFYPRMIFSMFKSFPRSPLRVG